MINTGNGLERGTVAHKDSFGFLRTVLTGATTWTDRIIRNTGIVVPHIAKNDIFTYNIQLNHDKQLQAALDGFHLHIAPVGAVTGGEIINIDYSWGIYHIGDVIPNTLPNSSNQTYTLVAGDQYKHLYYSLIGSMAIPGTEGYSSFVLIRCQRRNDGTDTYAGEFALLGADVHYTSDRYGSRLEYLD